VLLEAAVQARACRRRRAIGWNAKAETVTAVVVVAVAEDPTDISSRIEMAARGSSTVAELGGGTFGHIEAGRLELPLPRLLIAVPSQVPGLNRNLFWCLDDEENGHSIETGNALLCRRCQLILQALLLQSGGDGDDGGGTTAAAAASTAGGSVVTEPTMSMLPSDGGTGSAGTLLRTILGFIVSILRNTNNCTGAESPPLLCAADHRNHQQSVSTRSRPLSTTD